MRNLVYDIESNHYDLSIIHTIHCIVAIDIDTKELFEFKPDQIEEGVKFLHGNHLIGHYIINFDNAALKKFYPWFKPGKVTDTLILSRLARPKFIAHSLEHWGVILRFKKGSYAKDFKVAAGKAYKEGDEWKNWSQEMHDYCIQDVRVNVRIYEECMKSMGKLFTEESFLLEQYTTTLMEKQKAIGVGFDIKGAEILMCELLKEKEIREEKVRQTFGEIVKPGPLFTPKRDNKRLGYKKGVTIRKPDIHIPFNPGSRQHCIYWFKKRYNWTPVEFTKSGNPKINEAVLDDMPYPEAPVLRDYFMVTKLLGMVSEGDNAWLKKVTPEGRIHGSVNAQGTQTFRASHNNPNLGQIPKVKSNKEGILYGLQGRYGADCRSLFSHGMGDGWSFMGCDMSGIEFRLLAHYMHRFDEGALADTVLNGDIHSVNQKAAGLPTRDAAKTFIYAFIYGAGDAKIGSIIGGSSKQGQAIKKKFMSNLKGFATLTERVTNYRKQNKDLIRGIDGRHIYVPHKHTMLNYLLQSAGAILSKKWQEIFHQLAEDAGFTWGVDYFQALWVHDEVQCGVVSHRAEELGKLCVKAIEMTGDYYKLNCPITGEYMVGENWKDTH